MAIAGEAPATSKDPAKREMPLTKSQPSNEPKVVEQKIDIDNPPDASKILPPDMTKWRREILNPWFDAVIKEKGYKKREYKNCLKL